MDSATVPAAVDTPEQALVARPNHRHGKTGFLVRLGAYAFLAATIGASFFVDWKQKDAYVITAVGGAAYLALVAWSLLLSARALWKAERAVWPMIVILATLVDLSAFFMAILVWPYRQWDMIKFHPFLQWLLDGACLLMLPVLIPFLTGVLILAVPLAFAVIRRAERKNEAAWQRSKRWRWGLRIAFILALALGLPLLPPAVFLFCMAAPTAWYPAQYDTLLYRVDADVPIGYQALVAASMPQSVKDGSDSLLNLFGSTGTRDLLINMRGRILRQHASEGRLLLYIKSVGTDPVLASFAWQGLLRRFPKECNPQVAAILKSGSGTIPPIPAEHFIRTASIEKVMGLVRGQPGTFLSGSPGGFGPYFLANRTFDDPDFSKAMNAFMDENPKAALTAAIKKWTKRRQSQQ